MGKFAPLTLFAVAFALVEAAVVVYLRALYYPGGFAFPVKPPPVDMAHVELWREGATLLMLGSAAALAGGNGWRKFAFFMYAFGLWDVFYYVWLKVFIGWPASLAEPDVLFLIPVVWWGPVLAPCIVALSLCVAAVTIVFLDERGKAFVLKPSDVALVTAGACIILYTFMADSAALEAGRMPPPYRWGLFWCGELLGIFAFLLMLKRGAGG